MVLPPVLGEAARASWPPRRRMGMVFEPIRPVPPMTTIFIFALLSVVARNRTTVWVHFGFALRLRHTRVKKSCQYLLSYNSSFLVCVSSAPSTIIRSERERRSPQSLHWNERWSALVLDQEHHEFRRLGFACVPINGMNIVGAFIESLSWRQRNFFSTLHLHHNRALQYVKHRMCIVSVG